MSLNLSFFKKLEPFAASLIILCSVYRLPSSIPVLVVGHAINILVRFVTEKLHTDGKINKEAKKIARGCFNFLNICSCETSKIAYRDGIIYYLAFSEEAALGVAMALCLSQAHLHHQLFESSYEFFEKRFKSHKTLSILIPKTSQLLQMSNVMFSHKSSSILINGDTSLKNTSLVVTQLSTMHTQHEKVPTQASNTTIQKRKRISFCRKKPDHVLSPTQEVFENISTIHMQHESVPTQMSNTTTRKRKRISFCRKKPDHVLSPTPEVFENISIPVPAQDPVVKEENCPSILGSTAIKLFSQLVKASFPNQLKALSYLSAAFINGALSWHFNPDKYTSIPHFTWQSINKTIAHVLSREVLIHFTTGIRPPSNIFIGALIVHDVVREFYRKSMEEYCINPTFTNAQIQSRKCGNHEHSP